MKRVMSSLSKRTDMDLVIQDVSPEEFARVSRPAMRRELIDAYFPFASSRVIYESPVLQNVLSFLGLAHWSKGREAYATKYTVTAITRADSGLPYGTVTRPMVMVAEEGSWDQNGHKPFFDAQFGVMHSRISRNTFNKLFSIGVKPVFTEGRQDDTRDADWVVSWDRDVHGRLFGLEQLSESDLALLRLANAKARAYANEGRPHPERRVQEGGVFAQNVAVDQILYPIPTKRLTTDMMIELPHEQLMAHTRPIHIDASINERPVDQRMEQFRRAARKQIVYGDALHTTDEGSAHLKAHKLAIDEETINLIRSSVSPTEFRRHLLAMDPMSREMFLDAALADDLVGMHTVFDFIGTYRESGLGLFKYYPILSQITEAEWDRVIDAMKREKKVGEPEIFARKQYATLHAHEYETVDDEGHVLPTNSFAQWDLFKKYVNPYALFVRALRKARVSSHDVRDAVSGPHYLENLDRLLNMDPYR
jgi:hypothetical protein